MIPAEGWIKLHRQIADHWLWDEKPFSKGQAWIDLILLANHKDEKFPYKDKVVVGERGKVYRSILYLSERWGWNRKTTNKFISQLESDGMVTTERTTHGTTITIVNYSFFQICGTTKGQPSGQPDGQQSGQQSGQQGGHIQECKEHKECKEYIKEGEKSPAPQKERCLFKPPTVEEVRTYCQERGNKVDPEEFVDFYKAKDWMIGKNKMKDWKAAVRTWEKRKRTEPGAKSRNRFNNCESHGYDYEDILKQMGGI